MSDPVLSVVCMLGPRRERLPRLSAAIRAQTVADQLEVVLADFGGEEFVPALDGVRWRGLALEGDLPFGEVRASAVREAKGEIVAFLLDYCYPDPDWAEALIAAYREPTWAAVGYRIRNANPGGYVSDATFLAHYGPWERAGRGETDLLPGIEVSYRRRELLGTDEELGKLLEIDSTLHRRLASNGLRLAVEPAATAAEECFESLGDVCRADTTYARVLAVRRAEAECLSPPRRLIRGIAAPLVATSFRLARIWQGSPARRGEFIRCLPGLLAICVSWAVGEARGYLFGAGDAPRRLVYWELEAVRARG